MATKKLADDDKVTSLRLTRQMKAAIDRAVGLIQAERPEATVKAPDAIRTLLAEALRARKIPIGEKR